MSNGQTVVALEQQCFSNAPKNARLLSDKSMVVTCDNTSKMAPENGERKVKPGEQKWVMVLRIP
jgi:hypothetical protein